MTYKFPFRYSGLFVCKISQEKCETQDLKKADNKDCGRINLQSPAEGYSFFFFLQTLKVVHQEM